MGELQGSRLLVTGATSGIGRAVALRAAVAGVAAVTLVSRRRDPELERAMLDEGAGAVASIVADLRDPEQAAAAAAESIRQFDGVDAVVNAAGLSTNAAVVDADLATARTLFAINVFTPLAVMGAAIRDLRRRQQPGSIVNVSSLAAHGGRPEIAVYAASKAALVALTRNAAAAHRFDRIRVNAINLGATDTPGERTKIAAVTTVQDWLRDHQEAQPFGRLGTPEEAAEIIVFLLGNRAGVATGAVIDWGQRVIGAG